MSSRRSNKKRSGHGFPEEIIEEILVKLPVKSIVRFRSVSKSWFNLIKSTRFVNKHLNESEEGCLAMFFIVRDKKKSKRRYLALWLYDYLKETSTPPAQDGVNRFINICDSEKQAPNYTLPAELNFELPRLSGYEKSSIDLVGHCNGIMCLMTDYKLILLVSPSLKEAKTFPIPPVGYACKLVGFGFDNMTMDFKVVRILSSDRSNFVGQQRARSNFVGQPRAEVYNLRSNAWRELDEFPFEVDYAKKPSTIFNGVVHWCVGTQYLGWRMLTFNLASEVFQQIEFPQGWYNSDEDNVPALFVLNHESLAFVSYRFPVLSSQFVNVWTMNKHENGETWSKLYSIGPLPQLRPLSFSIKHKFFYKTDPAGKLVLYDMTNQCSSEVFDITRLRYEHRLDPWLEIGVCKPSLVSINM